MISVLHFTNAVVRGGAEEHILMLLRGLDRTVFRLYFACTPELADRVRKDVPEDVELIPLDLDQPTQLASMWRLRSILRDRKIHVLHSHMFYSSLCASPIGWLSRVPIVIETSHGREAWRKGWIKSHFIVDRFISLFVDKYIAVSQSNAAYLVSCKGLPKDKISVIYPGSDLSKFDPTYLAPAGLKASMGMSEDDPIVVFIGRLEPQKGHRILLEAMSAVREVVPRIRLICAGEGSLREELEQQVRTLRLEDNVRFIGYPEDIRDWLAIAYFTILPSLYEGLPVTPIESLAAGKTVVATAVDGTPEVVINEQTGLTVPARDVQALSAAMCRLLQNEQLRNSMAAKGREWVIGNFGVERLVSRTQALYLDLCKRHFGKGSADNEMGVATESIKAQI